MPLIHARLLRLVRPLIAGEQAAVEPDARPPLVRARRRIGGVAVDSFFRGLSKLGTYHPQANPARHGVEKLTNIAYRDTRDAAHLLDVYRPSRPAAGLRPAVIYAHGGGFRILSKDSHWLMGLAFARRGYVVFNINYRLAPQHRFPAAIEDACAAYAWVVENAHRFGADPARLIVSGESAGANLTAALTVAACFERPEPYAQQVFETGVVPLASMPACGMLQVSDWRRFGLRRPLSRWLTDRLDEVGEAYLPPGSERLVGGTTMADPLVLLEGDAQPQRPLPPFFVGVGTKDPLLDDTRRLARALEVRGVPCESRYYEGEVHAFQALIWRRNAQRFWRHTYRFLDDVLGPEAT